MPDAFSRDPETIEQQLIMASSRRTAAIAARDQADATVQRAVEDLDAALIDAAMRARHVDLATRQIDGLLDERLRSAATDSVTA